MTVDHEIVGQGEGDLAPRAACGVDGGAHRGARLFGIPKIAFEIEDARRADEVEVERGFGQELRGTEEGVHRPLRIGRHQDQAARGRDVASGGGRVETDAERAHVMREHVAQLVVIDLTDEAAAFAERGKTRQRVGGRAAADFLRLPHVGIEAFRHIGVDQLHAALGQRMFGEEGVVATGQNVDNGVADRNDIQCGGGRGHANSLGQRKKNPEVSIGAARAVQRG